MITETGISVIPLELVLSSDLIALNTYISLSGTIEKILVVRRLFSLYCLDRGSILGPHDQKCTTVIYVEIRGLFLKWN